MKRFYLVSLATAAILTGCGSSSNSSDNSTTTVPSASSNTIQVQRGPILGAIVTDTAGQVAQEDGNGSYTFKSKPSYPIIAKGGVIDIDRDGKASLGDIVNDLNLTSTGGSVITVATTFASNPATKAKFEQIISDLNISESELLSKTPSDSKEIEAVSNILYKYIKENNITNPLDGNDTKVKDIDVNSLKTKVDEEYRAYVAEGDSHDSKTKEQELVNTITLNINRLKNDAEVKYESDRIDTIHTIYENHQDDEQGLRDSLEQELGEQPSNLQQEAKDLKNEYEKEYGDIDYGTNTTVSRHNQGDDCLSCHSENAGGEGAEHPLSSGATVFTKLNAANYDGTRYANAYTIRLVLADTNQTINYTKAMATGNSYSRLSTATLNNFTAQVLDPQGNVVNSSLTNSHNLTRLACNSCHSATGTNAAPGRIVSFDYYGTLSTSTTDTNTTTPADSNTTTGGTTTPADTNTTTGSTGGTTTPTTTISFANDVLPVLNTNCKMCHGTSGNFSVSDSATAYNSVTGFVDTTTSSNSKLLQKASAQVAHGGGQILSTTSTQYTTIRDWIAEGANNN